MRNTVTGKADPMKTEETHPEFAPDPWWASLLGLVGWTVGAVIVGAVLVLGSCPRC